MAENVIISIDAELGQGLTRALDVLEKLGKISKADADAFRAMNQAGQQMAQGQDAVQKELSETEKKLKDVGTQSQKTNASIADTGKKTGDGIGVVNRGLGALSSSLSGIGAAIAGAFAVQSIINFAAESVRAFQEAERAALSLKSAVGVNGGLQSDFDELIKQSNDLQEVTIFSDDAIQRAQTAALQFGLTKEQVQALIPVVADFASATGQDLQAALDGVLQGVNGMGRGLKIYGVTIDENQTATERLSDITGQLTKKFEDQAEVIGKTAFGANEKYKNQLDDIQEKLGERLSPILQKTRGFFLQLGDGATTLAEKLFNLGENLSDFINGAEDKLPGLITKAGQVNSEAIAEATKSFQNLSNDQIAAKINVLTNALESAKEQAKGLNAEQAKDANQRIAEYANQITALENINAARSAGNELLTEQEKALQKLKNISALTNDELLAIKKTLESSNDINLRDEIKLIEDTIEKRKKLGEKEVSEREKNLEILHQLEKKASDQNLAVKASEVSKAVELEQEKQKQLRDLIESAGKASGVDVDPILLDFESTGTADIEKTIQLLQNAKFSTDEIEKFRQAVIKTNEAFDTLIENEEQAQREINIKINLQNVQSDFDDLKDVLEDFATREEIEIRTKFIQEGDFSPEAFEKLNKDIEAIQQRTTDKIIEEAKKMGVEQGVIDKLILASKEATSKKAVDDAQAQADEEVRIAREKAEKINEIAQQIADYASQAVDSIQQITNNYYENRLNALEADLERTLESYDRQAEANEELHDKNKRGDREYENNKKKLDAERKAAEDRAAAERKKLLTDQAKANKTFAVIQATINAALGVTSALTIAPPAGYILAALTAALAAVEIAAIVSQPIPQFAKGKEKIEGPGTDTSDNIHVMLSPGERVVKASTNRKYFPILSAIHHERFDPESMNMLSQMRPDELRKLAQVDKDLLKQLSTAVPVFIQPQPQIKFRDDIVPQLKTLYGPVTVVNKQQGSIVNEHDIRRAVSDAVKSGVYVMNPREIAKAIKEEGSDPYDKYR